MESERVGIIHEWNSYDMTFPSRIRCWGGQNSHCGHNGCDHLEEHLVADVEEKDG